MAVDGFGAAADHAALSGLAVGDPHPQYTITLQGLAAARPAQPVKQGTRYVATDTGEEWASTGSSWAIMMDPLTKAKVDALGVNATTLDTLDSTQFMRGLYTPGRLGLAGEYVQHLGQGTNGLGSWRVLGTVTFDSNDPVTTAWYTGWTAEVDIYNHWQSWGQTVPNGPFRLSVRITNSNTYTTTSTARTAQISGDWPGFDFLRVVRISEYVWQLQGRAAGDYQITSFKVREVVRAGGSIVYSDTHDPSVGTDGIGQTYFTLGGVGDSRGWVELTDYSSGWTPYQTGLGNSWTPRVQKKKSVVFIEGLMNGGPTGNVLTLPIGYRPGTGTVMRLAVTSAGYQRMDITSTGVVSLGADVVGPASTTGWHNIACSFPQEN